MIKTSAQTSYVQLAAKLGHKRVLRDLPVVCVQGLGHVGSAMATAIASAIDEDGNPCFNVIGVDLDNEISRAKIEAVNSGQLPVACTDAKFSEALRVAHERGNLVATSDPEAYALASVVVVDVAFDVEDIQGQPSLPWDSFRKAINTVFEHVPPGALVLIETTVPPGTCEKVVTPEAAAAMKRRSLPEDAVLIAHSYERVMPGNEYFDSIVRFWRVYAGHTAEAAEACETFLSKVIDTKNYPLTRLHTTTASETAKVLENSYRATNIAFIEEWGRFAEAVGIDLFEVIRAIRARPTHNNIRQPGFGVGGYCLTKDPLMAKLAAKELFGLEDMNFPFSTRAMVVNHVMPLVSLNKIDEAFAGLEGKTLLLLGISYRSDVGDTRFSPSETFVVEAQKRGAKVTCHDPLVTHWHELKIEVPAELPSPAGFDAVVFAVAHEEYRQIDLTRWLAGHTPLLFDANCVLNADQLAAGRNVGCRVLCVGRGDTT